MNIKEIQVNGKTLTGFDHYDGTDTRAAARRLLAHDDAVTSVEEGGREDLTVWIRGKQVTNWEPPRGYSILCVSAFCSEQSRTPSVAISLVEENDD